MKTKQILVLTLLLLGISLSQEAQAFYNPTIGRWLSRDPIEERGGVNLFQFLSNDALQRVDGDGRWASKFGHFVHQNTIDQMLGFLPSGEREMLKQRQGEHGIDGKQSGPDSYLHAMRDLRNNQSIAAARGMALAWVKGQLAKARKADRKCPRDRELAMFFLGNAMHTVQDNTSPVHKGFQGWDDRWSDWYAYQNHAKYELEDAVLGSELQAATYGLYLLFNQKAEPKLDEHIFDAGYWFAVISIEYE